VNIYYICTVLYARMLGIISGDRMKLERE